MLCLPILLVCKVNRKEPFDIGFKKNGNLFSLFFKFHTVVTLIIEKPFYLSPSGTERRSVGGNEYRFPSSKE